MKAITIYTDGACSGNPGPGGWGAVLLYGENEKCISGFEPLTTNNKMELTAAIEALGQIKESCKIFLYSDSAYLINAFNNKWLEKWQKNNWQTTAKKTVENQDLWLRLLNLSNQHFIQWIKVKGHADDQYNNKCDQMAKKQIKDMLHP